MIKRAIRRAIADELRRQWLDNEPTEECFDHDEDRMDSLLSFIGNVGRPEERERVRVHLVMCPRCRFIYCTMRTVEQSR